MQEELTPYGYCHCGCGELAPRATQTYNHRGIKKGEPFQFVAGHQLRVIEQPLRKRVRYLEEDRGYETACWIWQLFCSPFGYGMDRGKLAYRRKWEERCGPVPDGLELDHLCRVPSCVNPAHLEAVTHAENMRRGAITKLTVEDVRTIREWWPVAELTQREFAEAFGVGTRQMSSIVRSASWKGI